MNSFTIKRGDRLPALQATLSDEHGVYNLTGASVDVILRAPNGTVTRKTCTVADPTTGVVTYAWGTGDTDTAGTYQLEFEATIGGRTLTFPNGGFLQLVIAPDLD